MEEAQCWRILEIASWKLGHLHQQGLLFVKVHLLLASRLLLLVVLLLLQMELQGLKSAAKIALAAEKMPKLALGLLLRQALV